MKTNREIRKSVTATLKNRWFWRLVLVVVVLNSLPQLAMRLLTWAFKEQGIQTWQDFSYSWMAAQQSDLDYAVPSMRVAWEMTGSSLFLTFIVYVFVAIATLGLAIVALKAVRNDPENWFGASFDGFRRPLELVWFMVVINLRVFLWSMLFIVPGLIAIYRYRNGWYLKCEHPDWSASKCLEESARLMKGHKWQAFGLDLFYLIAMMVVMVLWLAAMGGAVTVDNLLVRVVSSVVSLLSFFWLMQLVLSILVARAEFYRETLAECAEKSSVSVA